MRNAGQDELLAGINIGGRNISLSYADDTTLMGESEEELKNLLMRMKEEGERVGLRLNIKKKKKTKIITSSPIIVWKTDGKKVYIVTDFLFLGSKITMDDDCSHEIRRLLLLGRKTMTNLDSVLKSRDITLPTKGPYSQVCGLSSGMYGCESCTVKKAEYQRIDVLELWCWRRLLKVPWTARR